MNDTTGTLLSLQGKAETPLILSSWNITGYICPTAIMFLCGGNIFV